MIRKYLFIISFALLLISPSLEYSVIPAQEEIKVILDFDSAPADWAAMLYLLKHPGVTVIGIGVSCGVSYIDTGVLNTLGILEYLEYENIPVASGKETPLVGDNAFPTPWRVGCYNYYGLELPTTSLQPSSMNASELIISLIENTETNVTLVALGPLTNIAIALEAEPSIKSKIDKILLMGGAIDVPGNVGLESDIRNYVAEWNIWVDPYAADIVFKSGLAIQMVTLDATNQVPMTQAFLDRIEVAMKTPEGDLLQQMMRPTEPYLWDQLAVVSLTNPEVVTWGRRCIEIILEPEYYEGWTNSTKTGCDNVGAAFSVDVELFYDLFIDYINDDFQTSTTSTDIISFLLSGPYLLITIVGLVFIVLVIFLIRRRK